MATNTEKIVVQVVVKGDKQLDKLDKKTGTTAKGFAKMTLGIGSALIAFRKINQVIAASIKTFRDFEFQMAKVKAVSGASKSSFKALSDSAQELGRTTFFTATQVAELQTNYAKLGFTTTEILQAQEATLALATATGSDLGRAAIVAGAAVRGFGLDASETKRVVDVMAVAFASSAMDIEKWQTSMTKVAPIAKSAGFSLEDTAAIMSKLTDSGIEASIAGTSLRNILLKMQDPSSDLTKSFGKTIHSFDELVPAMKKFVKEGGSMADVMEVVDLRQAAAFEQMITSADSAEELRNALLNANGAAEEMAGIVGDSLEGSFKRFTSALEGLQIMIIDGFIGQALKQILETGAKVLNFLTLAGEGFESVNDKIATSATLYRAQSVQLQTMADRYDVLAKNTKRTADEEKELKRILITLQDEFGRTVVSVDDKTDALILNRKALEDVIAKTVLLADTEALKLAHQLTKKREEIKLEQEKKDAIDGTIDSITSNIGLMADITASQSAVSDQTAINNTQYDAFGNVIERAVNNSNELLDAQDASAIQTVRITELKEEELLLVEQLTDAGWDEKEITDLLSNSIEENSKKRNKAIEVDEKSLILQKITDKNFKDLLELQEKLLSGKMTQAEFDEEVERRQIQLLENVLRHSKLTDEQRMELTKKLNELKIKGTQDAAEAQKIADEETLEAAKETSRQKLEVMKAASDAIFTIMADNLRSQTDRETKKLEERKDAGLITEEQYEEGVEAIQRKAFEKKKRLDIAQAIINGALAMTTVMGQTGVLSFAFSPFIAAMTAAQIAVIASQKFALGGMVEEFAKGGMVNGKSHAQGGEKFAVGGRVVELEGGEAVINKRSTAMFRPQLSAMNSAGGGVKFADGGLLNQPSFNQQQFNALGQNQMMGAMGGSRKVVVVEADITDSQDSVSVIQAQATI